MDRLRLKNFAFVLAATAVPVSLCSAQASDTQRTVPYPVRPVPSESSPNPYPTKPVPKTLSLPSENSSIASEHFIVYRPQEQMNESDRDLAAKSQPAIRTAAEFAGIEFDNAQWSYQQLECQAIPSHLILLFQSNVGAGNASLFSASIPRGINGHVRIIPVERRGFTLFSPAPVNAIAMAEFNRIRAEEPKGPKADWLSTSLCYAALTDPNLEMTLAPRQTADSDLSLSFPPSLEVAPDGGSTVRFVDTATPQQPMQWALTFDAKDQLVKVEHSPAPVYATRIIPKN
jgi:hypothetical protein